MRAGRRKPYLLAALIASFVLAAVGIQTGAAEVTRPVYKVGFQSPTGETVIMECTVPADVHPSIIYK